jgi:hypothetical protein
MHSAGGRAACASFARMDPGHAMKMPLLLCALLLIPSPGNAGGQRRPAVYYVSPSGSDGYSGRVPQVNHEKSDGPLATLERARDVLRAAKASGTPVRGVVLRGGVYRITTTLLLDSLDSGSAGSPVVWSAFPGESARLSGATVLEGFHHVTDSTSLRRIREPFRKAILVTNLEAQGVTDPGILPDRMQLYYRGKAMPIARFPARGWIHIADVPQWGETLINPGDAKIIKDGHFAGRHYGWFLYDGDRPGTWVNNGDLWMHGYWAWDWRDDYQRVERIDSAQHAIYPAKPYHHYGYIRGQRFCFLNVLEELDSPGQWYLDEQRRFLYFWPPSPLHRGEVSVSTLKKPMVELHNTSFVEFRKIIFEETRACAVRIEGGSHNLIAGCTVRNVGNDTAVVIDGGTQNGILSSDIHDVGGTALKLSGGDRRSLTPAGNWATNNHLYRYGTILQAFSGGIWMNGVGNLASHNRIHDAPFSGIQFYGNDHVIEFNNIFDLAHESGDVGGVNTGADYSEEGTTIRFNYFHDTHGPGEGGFRAVYLDLPGSNTVIEGNVFCNVDIGVFFNSGRDNTVRNNLFVDCHPAVAIYLWPHKAYFQRGGPWRIVEKLEAIHYREPPYSTRYPRLPSYLDSADLGMPYGNRVVENVSCAGTWLDLSEELNLTKVTVERNLIADSILLVLTRKWTHDADPYHLGYAATYRFGNPEISSELRERGNVLRQGDPGFTHPKTRDFHLSRASPAWSLGFKPIPLEQIGLFKDRYRTTIPADSTKGHSP